jgi:predicted transcriptional regulator
MKNRSRTEIIALILEIANNSNGVNKTKIMYNAFLSYPQLKQYLSFLLEKHLLDYRERERTYRTTDKGSHFLLAYSQISFQK